MTVPENNIDILIFPTLPEDASQGVISSYVDKMNAIVTKYSSDYFWHVDKLIFSNTCINHFSETIEYQKDSLPPFICTSLNFGESVDDEWFTVFLMLQISLDIPDVVVRLWDSDGEFLLIEAADHLPRWCNPESCSSMVFIYKGDIHIVDRSQLATNASSDILNIQEILAFIRNNEDKSKASPQVQEDIKSKIQSYPDAIKDQIHHTHAYLPINLARIIQAQPQLIANATRAFCARDTLEMKAVKNFPHFSSNGKMKQRVKFTKCLYAMLMSSQFVHPSLPAPSHLEYQPHSVGVRLMCGFEILLSQVQDGKSRNDKLWNQYLSSLRKKGYFKDLLQGSKDYKELESMAREFFMKNQCKDDPVSTVGDEILDLLQNSNIELLTEDPLLPADDDSWMNISSQDLDNILLEKFGVKDASCGSSGDVVSSAINRFLHQTSGVEGAEFPYGSEEHTLTDSEEREDSKPDVTSKRVRFADAMDVSSDEDEEDESQVEFKLDEFSSAINNILDQLTHSGDPGPDLGSDEDSEDLSGSDSDEYMQAMERELSGTTLAQSFVKKEEDDAVDIDMNALHNVIQSYEAQIGTAGPASNVLTPMGINIRALLEKKPDH